jgi:hypothetical protein
MPQERTVVGAIGRGKFLNLFYLLLFTFNEV